MAGAAPLSGVAAGAGAGAPDAAAGVGAGVAVEGVTSGASPGVALERSGIVFPAAALAGFLRTIEVTAVRGSDWESLAVIRAGYGPKAST